MLGGRVWVCFNWWDCSADSLPRSCSVLLSPQWWDSFQKHDNSLWVGETANASADRRLASWHSSFCDLWRPILHRWQLWYQHPVPATEVLCEDNSEYGAIVSFHSEVWLINSVRSLSGLHSQPRSETGCRTDWGGFEPCTLLCPIVNHLSEDLPRLCGDTERLVHRLPPISQCSTHSWIV